MKFLKKGLLMELKENERIDDLELNDLKIIQNKNWFCFGIDSVLLANFAKSIHRNSNILDLGAGNGILELLLSAKIEGAKLTGIEVQENVCNLAKRSVELNHLENTINMININIKDFKSDIKYDAVVTNPPYKANGTGLKNELDTKVIARHEVLATLEDFIKVASDNLKDKCSMYMVNRVERVADILELSRKYKLEPKELQFVHSKAKEAPVLVLVKATKNANKFLKVKEPLYIYNDDGSYTDEILKIYGKK